MDKEIDSGKLAPSKSRPPGPENRIGSMEAARVHKERAAGRFATAKAKLTKSAMKIIESAPASYQDRLVKACLGLASPKVCIRAQCEQCVGWEEVKIRVGDCRSFGCALHHYRPYQKPDTP